VSAILRRKTFRAQNPEINKLREFTSPLRWKEGSSLPFHSGLRERVGLGGGEKHIVKRRERYRFTFGEGSFKENLGHRKRWAGVKNGKTEENIVEG